MTRAHRINDVRRICRYRPTRVIVVIFTMVKSQLYVTRRPTDRRIPRKQTDYEAEVFGHLFAEPTRVNITII